MPDSPVVSVLLPVRNGEAHLDECISSLVAQDLEDFEVIVVDDGSVDNTSEIVRRWAENDQRIRLLSRPARGIVPALNEALSLARADFVARMDADDVAIESRFSEQLALMERRPDLVGCGAGVEYFPSEVVRDGARRYERWINSVVTPDQISRARFVECPLPHPTFFLRRKALSGIGGYRDVEWAEDYDVVLRLLARGDRLGKVPCVLLRWRESAGRLSRLHPRYSTSSFLACKAHFLMPFLGKGATARPAVIWGAGPTGKAWARALLARGAVVRAFVDLDPRKIGQVIHGAPVVEPGAATTLSLTPGSDSARPLHLAAVGQEGARERILGELSEAGLKPEEDFFPVA